MRRETRTFIEVGVLLLPVLFICVLIVLAIDWLVRSLLP